VEDADGHLEAWPVVRHLVPIGLRLVELLADIGPGATAEDLALDLDPGLAPYAWSHPAEWAVAADVLEQIAETLENLTIHTLPPADGLCEARRRRGSAPRRGPERR
jgi:hypothetical protein